MMEAHVDAGPLLDVILYRDNFSVPIASFVCVCVFRALLISYSHSSFRSLPLIKGASRNDGLRVTG